MNRFTRCMRLVPAVGVVVALVATPNTAGASSGTMTITSDTTLTEDHQGSIVVEADNVTLDCAGHTITGPAEGHDSGIFVEFRSGVKVTNCNVTGFTQGIEVADSQGVLVVQNHSFDNPGNGFHVIRSSATILADNIGTGNDVNGFATSGSEGTSLEDNRFEGNATGIGLVQSTGSLVEGNRSTGNGRGLILLDSSDNLFRQNAFTDNAEPGAGWGVLLVRSSRNRFFGNSAGANEGEGFLLVDSSDGNLIKASSVTVNGGGGVTVVASSGNAIIENRVMHNRAGGISLLVGSSFNIVRGNLACRNGNVDAFDDLSGNGNDWGPNRFCTSNNI